MEKLIQIELLLIEASAAYIIKDIKHIMDLEDFEIKQVNREEIDAIAGYILDKAEKIKASLNKLLKIKNAPPEIIKKTKIIAMLNSQIEDRANTIMDEETESFLELMEDISSSSYKIVSLIEPLIEKN